MYAYLRTSLPGGTSVPLTTMLCESHCALIRIACSRQQSMNEWQNRTYNIESDNLTSLVAWSFMTTVFFYTMIWPQIFFLFDGGWQ